MTTAMKTLAACLVLLAGVVTVQGEYFNCTAFNPAICQLDAIRFCVTNGTILTGRCYAKRAVCLEGKTLDETFAACGQTTTGKFDCSNYNPFVCTRDLIPFCLNNGTIVRGTCLAKRAVCKEGKQVEENFEDCNKAAATGQRTKDNNSASALSQTISLCLLFFVLVFMI